MYKAKLYIRIGALCVITLALTAVAVMSLLSLQSARTAPAIARGSELRYTSDVKAAAARGQILDRYGRELVTNRLSYNISLNRRQMTVADTNTPGAAADGILGLISLCRGESQGYEDTFPVTFEPYRYKEEMTRPQEQRLARFLETVEHPDVSAGELMEILRERYLIPEDCGGDDARLVVGVRYEMELRELFFNIPPYVFAEDISVRLITLIEERRLPGVIIEAVAAREYRTEYAAHLLGRVGPIFEDEYENLKEQGYPMDAVVGKDGIEKAAEPWLRGIDGSKRIETTAAGQITKESYVREPLAGKHVFTTIDIRLQEAVERALERGINDLRATGIDTEGGQAQGGAAVVILVGTGEILAMASYPSFELNKFGENYADMLDDPLRPMYNRAIAGTYPPGSTFKMCSALAALESGTITTRKTIFDQVRYMYYAPSYTPRCTGSHGNVDIRGALKVSCNYFFYEMGRLLGISKMEDYAKRMGLGQKSGIEIDGERVGTLAGPEYAASQKLRWFDGDTIQASIGQSYHAFTPLQMAVYTATVANGGLRYRPHLLKSVRSYDFSREAFDIVPEVIEDLNPSYENIKAVQDGMLLATQTGGTAARVFSEYPISVASKTGTAQTASASRPDNGVFVAYAPFENPEIAVAVVVEKGAGGSRVAPIARDIFTAYFEINGKMTNIETEY